MGPVSGEEALTEVCRLGSVLIGGRVNEEESNGARVIVTCVEGELAVDGRFFCSFLGGDEVSKNELGPPPNDIRLVKEPERLWVCDTVLDPVDFDHRLRLPPCESAWVRGLVLIAFWRPNCKVPARSRLVDRAALKDDDRCGETTERVAEKSVGSS